MTWQQAESSCLRHVRMRLLIGSDFMSRIGMWGKGVSMVGQGDSEWCDP